MTDQLTLDALYVDPLADAIAWKRENPAAYAQIVTWAREQQAAGERPAIDTYATLLRYPSIATKLGLIACAGPYRVNNNLRASLARLVMREYPLIRFETRDSSYDEPGVPNARPA